MPAVSFGRSHALPAPSITSLPRKALARADRRRDARRARRLELRLGCRLSAPTGLHVSVTQTSVTIAWDRSGYPNFIVSKGANDLATIPDTTYTYTGIGCDVRFNAGVAGLTASGQRPPRP